jgi:hypothetical protein
MPVLSKELKLGVQKMPTKDLQKLHKDYLLDYKDDINGYLRILHRRSNHIDLIYGLPDNI